MSDTMRHEHINPNRGELDIRSTEHQASGDFEGLPRVPEGVERVVLVDVDGTLLQVRPGCPEPRQDRPGEVEAYLEVNAAVASRLQSMQAAGFTVEAWTGRTMALRAVTVRQLRLAGLSDVVIHGQFDWRGYSALWLHKAQVAENRRAVLAIGDMDLDRNAAVHAGTPFMHVQDFAAGEDLDFLFCIMCGCTALRACKPRCAWHDSFTCTNCGQALNAIRDATIDTPEQGGLPGRPGADVVEGS